MKLAALLLVALALVPTAQAATQSTPAPELDAVASAIAGHDVEVRCWKDDAGDTDSDAYSWGYVHNVFDDVLYLGPLPCAGALALVRGEFVPLWQVALGALTLTHEAYHLKDSLEPWRRESEAQTECRAIKRWPQTMTALGASDALREAALPWALAAHFKISTLSSWGGQSYDYPSCNVPGFEWWPR